LAALGRGLEGADQLVPQAANVLAGEDAAHFDPQTDSFEPRSYIHA
jgi:hypothetical protein